MKKLGLSLMIISSLAFGQIAPQSPADAQRYGEEDCRMNAKFIVETIYKTPQIKYPIEKALSKVNAEYQPTVFFLYSHPLGPYEAFYFVYGFCIQSMHAGKDNT